MPTPPSTLPMCWWKTASGMVRPYLKAHQRTLRDLTGDLDAYRALGIDAVEVFAPLHGGVCYNGLDTLDFYTIDPAIGTLEDFTRLITEAHARHIAVVMFINLGYGHEQLPVFLKACDDVRAGVDSPEARMFCWSATGQERMDRSRAPYFMNDTHGNWRWSERARKYFWVKWEGERGGYRLPQFNFADPGWQAEVQRILHTWLKLGADGMVIDAVNWYVGCTWDICRASMTDVIGAADNQFCQPEGAGGFQDDPMAWVTLGGWNCVMDYSIKLWWEGKDTIGDAVRTADPRPIEAALQGYRDRVVAAGGVCYIDPPGLDDLSLPARLLGAALTASLGELLILIGEQTLPQPQGYCAGLAELLHLRKRYPVLCAGGERRQLPTSDDARFYALLRQAPGVETVLAVFNFQPQPETVQVDLVGTSFNGRAIDLISGETVDGSGRLAVALPAYGYRFFSLSSSGG
jgi:glycosidase